MTFIIGLMDIAMNPVDRLGKTTQPIVYESVGASRRRPLSAFAALGSDGQSPVFKGAPDVWGLEDLLIGALTMCPQYYPVRETCSRLFNSS